jgi:hypothetical protein
MGDSGFGVPIRGAVGGDLRSENFTLSPRILNRKHFMVSPPIIAPSDT